MPDDLDKTLSLLMQSSNIESATITIVLTPKPNPPPPDTGPVCTLTVGPVSLKE